MAEAQFSVAFAGPLVSLQDAGRPGHLRFGVPASGAMDRRSLALANIAVGRPLGAPVIEVSLGGLTLDCTEGAVSLAITGGGFVIELDGQTVAPWGVLTIRAGQRLVVRRGHWGAWAYLAFAGDLDAPRWLGSASTIAASGLGGGMVKTGGTLKVRDTATLPDRRMPLPVTARPRAHLHVVPGPQTRCFRPEALEALLSGSWHVTPQGDRMGVRLKGPALELGDALQIPSEPILRGSIQVAGDGVATVLMADHQTTGGYPKIATMLDDDLDGFAQLRPGDALDFARLDPDAAVEQARFHAARLEAYFEHAKRAARL
ncbi:allophanate hydrolase [Pararhodobacter marinus]|uniref:Allophanate hydrolase n=1 Tax=Pararhodobacter marinus TaxID=2184063 RepID=A0A2U2CBC7_9RHOB|nr:biotin-dependent carboxyltransferase family protein [Pararhodobacter marinus]PWE29170.1 allophanate hydrolase [Pararhodobacter marinus]